MYLTDVILPVGAPSSPWSIGCYVNPGSGRVVLQSPFIILLGFEFGNNFTTRATTYQSTPIVVVVILTVRRRFSDCMSSHIPFDHDTQPLYQFTQVPHC